MKTQKWRVCLAAPGEETILTLSATRMEIVLTGVEFYSDDTLQVFVPYTYLLLVEREPDAPPDNEPGISFEQHKRFILALKDALAAGFCYLSIIRDDSGRRVGWEDDEYIYLLNGAKEIVDQWLRQSGQPGINISKKELRKRLYQDGLTYSTQARVERGLYDYQAKDPDDGKLLMVSAIYKEKFTEIEEA